MFRNKETLVEFVFDDSALAIAPSIRCLVCFQIAFSAMCPSRCQCRSCIVCEDCAAKVDKCPHCRVGDPEWVPAEMVRSEAQRLPVWRCATCGLRVVENARADHSKCHSEFEMDEIMGMSRTRMSLPAVVLQAIRNAHNIVEKFAPAEVVQAHLWEAGRILTPIGFRNPVILCGASGAGKSALLNELIGFDLVPVREEIQSFSVTAMDVEILNTGMREDSSYHVEIQWLSASQWLHWRVAAANHCTTALAGKRKQKTFWAVVDGVVDVLCGPKQNWMENVLVPDPQIIRAWRHQVSITSMASRSTADPISAFLSSIPKRFPMCCLEIHGTSRENLQKLMETFCATGWRYLIQRVRVEGFLGDRLPVGVGVVDCPGGGDADSFKRSRTLRTIRAASRVLFVVNTKRNLFTENGRILQDIRDEHPDLLHEGRLMFTLKGVKGRDKANGVPTLFTERWRQCRGDMHKWLQVLNIPVDSEVIAIENQLLHCGLAEGELIFAEHMQRLRGVLLSVEPGEVPVLVGVSGAGKSTLLNDVLTYNGFPDMVPVRNEVQVDATTAMEIAFECNGDYDFLSFDVSYTFITAPVWIDLRKRLIKDKDSGVDFLLEIWNALQQWVKNSSDVRIPNCEGSGRYYQEDMLEDLLSDRATDPISLWLSRLALCITDVSVVGDCVLNKLLEVSGGLMHYIVCRVQVKGNFSLFLAHGVTLVDCPGAGDPDVIHSNRTAETLKKATRIIMVVNFRRNVGTEGDAVVQEIETANPTLLRPDRTLIVAKGIVDSLVYQTRNSYSHSSVTGTNTEMMKFFEKSKLPLTTQWCHVEASEKGWEEHNASLLAISKFILKQKIDTDKALSSCFQKVLLAISAFESLPDSGKSFYVELINFIKQIDDNCFAVPENIDFSRMLFAESACQTHHMSKRAFANHLGEWSGARGQSYFYTRALRDFFRATLLQKCETFLSAQLKPHVERNIGSGVAELINFCRCELMQPHVMGEAVHDAYGALQNQAAAHFDVPFDIYFYESQWNSAVSRNIQAAWLHSIRSTVAGKVKRRFQDALVTAVNRFISESQCRTGTDLANAQPRVKSPSQVLVRKHLHQLWLFLLEATPTAKAATLPPNLSSESWTAPKQCVGSALMTRTTSNIRLMPALASYKYDEGVGGWTCFARPLSARFLVCDANNTALLVIHCQPDEKQELRGEDVVYVFSAIVAGAVATTTLSLHVLSPWTVCWQACEDRDGPINQHALILGSAEELKEFLKEIL